MALNPTQRAELNRLLVQIERVKKALVGARAEVASLESLLAELGAAISRAHELEAFDTSSDIATRQARDRALRDAAEVQEAAGRELVLEHLRAGMRLKIELSVENRAQMRALIHRHMDDLSYFSDSTIRAAMERMGTVAAALGHELDTRIFSFRANEVRAEFGVSFGGGVDRGLVDAIWKGRDAQLEYITNLDPSALLKKSYREAAEGLADQVKRLVSLGKNARTSFPDLQRAGLQGYADLPKWIRDVRAAAKGALAGDRDSREVLNKALAKAEGYVEQLGSATERGLGMRGPAERYLRDIDKAVKQLSEDAIDSAVDKWAVKKAGYNSITAMRTGTNMTYREVSTRQALERPWVWAMRFVRSASHPRIDICDAMAEADFGRGPGVYAIGETPSTHNSCLCRLEPMIDKNFLDHDGKALAWEKPNGYDDKIATLQWDPGRSKKDSAFYRKASGAKSIEELRATMKGAGMLGNPPIPLHRVDAKKLGPANLL